MQRQRPARLRAAFIITAIALSLLTAALTASAASPSAGQGPEPEITGIYRGAGTAVQFDVSRPLRELTPTAPQERKQFEIPELSTGLEGALGVQEADGALQTTYGPSALPAPIISFDGPPNLSGVSPPDPVGDVGPNHYVAMSNLSFQIFDKSGTSLYGPAPNNTLWAGFGGPCQTENSGDPIVLHDQISDRWMLSQFTSAGPTYYICVAISTTPDPTGSYFRYAFNTGSNFPDYPKFGWWSDALYISTREFAGGSTYVGVGAYAVNRAQLIAGNPTPTVISFLVTPAAAGGAYNIGDGLLPADLDGSTPPPPGSPAYYVGSMDNGGPYAAPQDALTLWEFSADFTTPANSTFVLASTIPIAPIDTIPAFCSGRSCIPQPGTANKVDHLGYRQRPLHRLAYRNFGAHESLVTNQAVEASTTMSGIRWWEIRSPNNSPVLYQEGTYAPGILDGIHRWMGSIAMDGDGNMALGYSASDGVSTYPSSWYTGRLSTDPLGAMPQGEGQIVNGTGSQTGSQRWGDYSSMNVDPADDCTFWYVNQWIPTTSSVGWRLRIGAFRFPACGASPSISLVKTVGTTPGVCAATSSIQVPQGTTVYYCYAVTNNGNVTLNLHDLVDDHLGAIFSGLNYVLAPGASVNTVDAGLTISAVINATTTNIATWTAYNTNGASATATATATVTVTGGRVYGYVFDDLNTDSWRNAGETTGPAGVPVRLTRDGVPIATYWSNAPSGWYDFGILNPGTYCVEITTPAGYAPTSPTEVCFTLGGTGKNVNFGLDKARASIGDRVFFDANSNGVFDLGEYGIGNVTVDLWTSSGGAPGAVIATTATAADGTYLFANVLPGDYFVQVTDDNGELTELSLTTAGNPLGPITVVHLQTYLDADFGYNLVCSSTRGAITGRVWNDVNADGVQDAGEAGIAGVTACAEPVSYLNTRCRTTNSAGYFYMCVPRGTYLVAPLTDEEPLASMTPTTPEFYLPVVIRPGGSFTTAFFGYK